MGRIQGESQMSESFNFEYCRCCTCGYEWRKGLNRRHSCAENLQKQLAEAREALDIMKGNLELAIDISNSDEVINLSKACLNQLKEKGK